MTNADIASVARQQLGLVTHEQASACVTPGALKRALRDRRLELVRRSVYRVAGAPVTWEQHVLAACLAAGPDSSASFRTAMFLWNLPGSERPDRIEVTVPRRRRARLPGVTVHQTVVRGPRHFTQYGAVPCSTPARTLCDATAVWRAWRVERAVDDALRRKITSLRTLTRVFLDLATRGRRRSSIMRAVLDERLPGFHPGDSDPEAKIASWLRIAGLPPPVQQHRVRVDDHAFRLDLAYPGEKVDVEYDGWDTHRVRSTFDADRERDQLLELDGWLVLRFTSAHGRATVVERIATALAMRSK